MDRNDRAIIETLITLNDPLFACEGCTIDRRLDMAHALSADRLKSFLTQYGPGR
ncbi:MAG: hypothetical protein ABIQ57_04570 [Candidatus Kapaibacterium sp.]